MNDLWIIHCMVAWINVQSFLVGTLCSVECAVLDHVQCCHWMVAMQLNYHLCITAAIVLLACPSTLLFILIDLLKTV